LNENDLVRNFPSLTAWPDLQQHDGVEAIRHSIHGPGSSLSIPNMQPTTLTSALGGTPASIVAGTMGMPNLGTTFNSCSTSQSCGYHCSSPPMVMTNHPQHLEPHAIGVPCQRHEPRQANTLPVLAQMPASFPLFSGGVPLESLMHTTVPTNMLWQRNGTQVTTVCEHTVEDDLLRNGEASNLQYLQVAGCRFAPLPSKVEACSFRSPNDLAGNL